MEVAGVEWGISMAGWIISPYITRLLDKVYPHIKPDDKSWVELHNMVTHVVPRLKLVLEASDGRKHKVFIEAFVRDLKSAFRDTEDILDDIEYIRHPNKARRRKQKRKRKFQESGPSNQILGRLNNKLDKNIKIIERLIDEACKTLSIQTELRGSNMARGTGSAEHEKDANAKNKQKEGASPPLTVTGRDDDCERIMKMLEQDDNSISSGTRLSVIGIHGSPGSGKTTLAQYIFQKEKKAGYFDLLMWIHVSEKFKLDTIFMEMIEQAGKNKKQFQRYNCLVQLGISLKELLTGNRFLLVLDDIRCSEKVNEKRKLQRLIPPLTAANTKTGSKILVTSRSKDALSELGPDVRKIQNYGIPELDDEIFLELLMHNAFGHRNRDVAGYRMLLKIGTEIAQKLSKSPLLACMVGRMLYKNHDVEHWKCLAEHHILEKFMGPLWWCYQHLDEEVKRCFSYCSIFPRRHCLYRDEVVNLWVAEGFISTTNEICEMELVGRSYFDELLSVSFLQPGGKDKKGKDFFVIHDLLHDLAEMVAGRDCFKGNNSLERTPSDVCHLSIENCSASMIIEDIIKLKKLRTLIIYHGEEDISEEVLKRMFMELTKLRVFIFRASCSYDSDDECLKFPKSINHLKHLRYLGFEELGQRIIYLPRRIGELYLLQVLDMRFDLRLRNEPTEYEVGSYFDFPRDADVTSLTNLRHVVGNMDMPFPNIGKLTSLHTMAILNVERGDGHELHQLGELNNVQGELVISGLAVVNGKEEALRAKLADKRGVTSLSLSWYSEEYESSPEVQADVLEGLCPPEGLQIMEITEYHGSKYPEWMFGPVKSKMHLQTLELYWCGKLVPAPVPELFFVGVTSLRLCECSWDAMPYNMVHLTELVFCDCHRDTLPDNMYQLTSLKRLIISACLYIRRIPALPMSLQYIEIEYCHEEFTKSCKDKDHPNYKAIENIPEMHIVSHPSPE